MTLPYLSGVLRRDLSAPVRAIGSVYHQYYQLLRPLGSQQTTLPLLKARAQVCRHFSRGKGGRRGPWDVPQEAWGRPGQGGLNFKAQVRQSDFRGEGDDDDEDLEALEKRLLAEDDEGQEDHEEELTSESESDDSEISSDEEDKRLRGRPTRRRTRRRRAKKSANDDGPSGEPQETRESLQALADMFGEQALKTHKTDDLRQMVDLALRGLEQMSDLDFGHYLLPNNKPDMYKIAQEMISRGGEWYPGAAQRRWTPDPGWQAGGDGSQKGPSGEAGFGVDVEPDGFDYDADDDFEEGFKRYFKHRNNVDLDNLQARKNHTELDLSHSSSAGEVYVSDEDFERSFSSASNRRLVIREREEAEVDDSGYAAGDLPPTMSSPRSTTSSAFIKERGSLSSRPLTRKEQRAAKRRSYSTTACTEGRRKAGGIGKGRPASPLAKSEEKRSEEDEVSTASTGAERTYFDRAEALKELNPFQLVSERRDKHGKNWYNEEEVKKRGMAHLLSRGLESLSPQSKKTSAASVSRSQIRLSRRVEEELSDALMEGSVHRGRLFVEHLPIALTEVTVEKDLRRAIVYWNLPHADVDDLLDSKWGRIDRKEAAAELKALRIKMAEEVQKLRGTLEFNLNRRLANGRRAMKLQFVAAWEGPAVKKAEYASLMAKLLKEQREREAKRAEQQSIQGTSS